ncbi:AI-2E family transporter [Clostridium estertheticum]|uniref:AI-2E family transporter n=2 Tax=Clostridium estertheticum TaxID=238834 RepID=A0A1J0GH65_9CLOT|nr:AI-2E family transporter [Clostridium estertheticum]APC40706.1 AI-2E family transporter [Clostridium estertheticum subsp. estertheticum]MBU3074322.1 AI-2E family transporter [Clostridium estertheticum]MBU3164416.1 AI-2E family transporter [Clostridium estertheticum]MBU3170933.1 AI-2E family transporter [Clostridium estertheticum]MBU3184423.1 AI-2E family transporter [Clostridium estertheticum]
MQSIKQICKKESLMKIMLFLVLVLFAYLIRSIFDLILLTFMITYLVNSMQSLLVCQINKIIKVSPTIITIIIYVFITATIALLAVKYIPLAISESLLILDKMEYINFAKNTKGVMPYLSPIVNQIDIASYAKSGIQSIMLLVTNLGKWSINFFMALLLSLVFILEKKSILNFVHKFRHSRVSGAYNYFSYFGNNFLNSFGKVIQAQIMIAITNTVLSIIGLTIMGFPQLFALAFMIFILSLVPVAGVFISLIPLCLIALKIGGVVKVFFVLIMIFIIHAIESYILNPKFMSDTTHLPIFFTFATLIISEHFMGTWGLLLGIPIVIFLLDLIGVNLSEKSSPKFTDD